MQGRSYVYTHDPNAGAWTAAALKHLGVSYPLKHGWKEELKQKDFTQEQIDAFLRDKNVFSKATLKRYRKLYNKQKHISQPKAIDTTGGNLCKPENGARCPKNSSDAQDSPLSL